MGCGNFARSYSPASKEAWSLLELGWVKVDAQDRPAPSVNPVATSDTVHPAAQTPGEYFLIENREAVESDTAQMNPAFAPAEVARAVRLAHRPEPDQRRPAGQPDEYRRRPGRVADAGRRAQPASRLTGAANNRGDVGDAYPGSTSNTVLDGYTNPGLTTNAGKLVPGRIDSIRIVGNTVLFRFRVENLLQVTKFGTGTGTVTASVPGNTTDGVGVTPGTVVTVTAIPDRRASLRRLDR